MTTDEAVRIIAKAINGTIVMAEGEPRPDWMPDHADIVAARETLTPFIQLVELSHLVRPVGASGIREGDPIPEGLLSILRGAGDTWGPLGVAKAAAKLTDRNALLESLGADRGPARAALERRLDALVHVAWLAADRYEGALSRGAERQALGTLTEFLASHHPREADQ